MGTFLIGSLSAVALPKILIRRGPGADCLVEPYLFQYPEQAVSQVLVYLHSKLFAPS